MTAVAPAASPDAADGVAADSAWHRLTADESLERLCAAPGGLA